MPKGKKKPRPTAEMLGSGLAARAAKAIESRKRNVDDYVTAAQKGKKKK